MAKNTDNLFTQGFRGTVGGNMTFRRKKSGNVFVSKRAKATEIPATAIQTDFRNKFKRAAKYAKAVMSNLVKKAMYATGAVGDQSAFNVALKDALKLPVIVSINKVNYHGFPNDTVSVEATDDFAVVAVTVTIKDPAGDVVEEGSAILDIDGLEWLYTATAENDALAGSKIIATAQDNAGNTATLEVTL